VCLWDSTAVDLSTLSAAGTARVVAVKMSTGIYGTRCVRISAIDSRRCLNAMADESDELSDRQRGEKRKAGKDDFGTKRPWGTSSRPSPEWIEVTTFNNFLLTLFAKPD
jgi:hypothetical protein